MRVWTRINQGAGKRKWVAVDGDKGNIAWLQNNLLLQYGESPFWADWGIPIQRSLITAIMPDFYLNRTQQRFRGVFNSIKITRDSGDTDTPSYTIALVLSDGSTYLNGQTYQQAFNQDYSQTGPWPS